MNKQRNEWMKRNKTKQTFAYISFTRQPAAWTCQLLMLPLWLSLMAKQLPSITLWQDWIRLANHVHSWLMLIVALAKSLILVDASCFPLPVPIRRIYFDEFPPLLLGMLKIMSRIVMGSNRTCWICFFLLACSMHVVFHVYHRYLQQFFPDPKSGHGYRLCSEMFLHVVLVYQSSSTHKPYSNVVLVGLCFFFTVMPAAWIYCIQVYMYVSTRYTKSIFRQNIRIRFQHMLNNYEVHLFCAGSVLSQMAQPPTIPAFPLDFVQVGEPGTLEYRMHFQDGV